MSSAKTDTWMPLYIGEYLADTQHLSTLEHGAYLLLLMCYWRKKGPLPDDDVKLSRMAGLSLKQWKAIRSNIVELFRAGDGQLVSKRSEREIEASRIKSEKARANALERHNKGDADAEQTQCDGNAECHAESMLTGAHPPASPLPSPVPPEHKSSVSKETAPTISLEAAYFAEIKRMLDANAGGFGVRLKKHFGGDYVKAFNCLGVAATKENPREFLGAVLRGEQKETREQVLEETRAMYKRMGVI